jgi:hypothetical protein
MGWLSRQQYDGACRSVLHLDGTELLSSAYHKWELLSVTLGCIEAMNDSVGQEEQKALELLWKHQRAIAKRDMLK